MDELKLYEYDYEKPELNDEFLAHYGILGMHWGIRKKKPSSGHSRRRARKLKRKRIKSLRKAREIRAKNRAAKQEIEKTKEEIIRTKDAKEMLKNVDKFTSKEITDFLSRMDTEQKLRDYVGRTTPKSKKEKFGSFVKSSIGAGAREVGKTILSNGTKLALKELAKSVGAGDEEYEQLIEKLFKEKKK